MQSLTQFQNIIKVVGLKVNSSFIKKILENDIHKPIGRWNIDCNTNQINRRIDLANEDNCGPCGQYNTKNQLDMSLEELEILYNANVRMFN
jgi:hypothetical protein